MPAFIQRDVFGALQLILRSVGFVGGLHHHGAGAGTDRRTHAIRIDHVLGWRSANFINRPASAPGLALLLRNVGLSGDVGLRFSDRSWPAWPLRAETFAA